MAEIHIPSLAPEVVADIGPVAITNTMISAWVALAVFLAVGFLTMRRVSLRPGKWQNGCEYILEILFGYFDQVTGAREKTRRFLPIVGSIFFFILLSNWLGLLPGAGSLSFAGEPVLRPAMTDLNLTLAMALTSVIVSHVFGFVSVGVFTHLGKFFQIKGLILSFAKGPLAVFTALVELMVGFIEIISEVAKVLSLSLRLFGNIFAGEVLISVIGALASAVAPAPFMMLELLVGLIQAAVFAMLTLVYLTVATSAPHGTEH